MKNVIKKYHKLNGNTTEMLEELYMYHELKTALEDYENVKLKTYKEVEILLAIGMNCTYLTNLRIDEIVRRLLEILNCGDFTVNDLDKLDTNELIELMERVDDDCDENTIKVIADFFYKGLFCVLLKDKEKYILSYEKSDEESRILIFNNIVDLLSIIIQRDLILSKEES